jgi:hypothetical protein
MNHREAALLGPKNLRRRPLGGVLLLSGLLASLPCAGCGKKGDAGTPPPAGSVASPPKPTAAASATIDAASFDTPSPLDPGETLMMRIAREAKNRPKVTPTAEDVFAAFEKAGVTISERQQTLAKTYKANYCIGGMTPNHQAGVNVCEYPDDATAAAAQAWSSTLFPAMTNRTVHTRGATTLTIILTRVDAPSEAQQKKLVDLYSKL